MIIPVRCITCGKCLYDKWQYYKEEVESGTKEKLDESHSKSFDGSNLTGKLLDNMGLDRMCCRRSMLGHVDLIDTIK